MDLESEINFKQQLCGKDFSCITVVCCGIFAESVPGET